MAQLFGARRAGLLTMKGGVQLPPGWQPVTPPKERDEGIPVTPPPKARNVEAAVPDEVEPPTALADVELALDEPIDDAEPPEMMMI